LSSLPRDDLKSIGSNINIRTMQDEKKAGMPSEDATSKVEIAAPPSGDERLGEGDDKYVINDYVTMLFGSDVNPTEIKFVVFATCLIALNSGFVNGVTMSAFFMVPPKKEVVAGFAGHYTSTAIYLIEHDWEQYTYHLFMIISYMAGAFVAAMISPHARPYVIEPRYGPTFTIGGTMLLVASILAKFEKPSQYVFFLVAASNGVQNGIASIYSANLIRCTLTGATTDIAIIIAQCIHGNYKGLARGVVLTAIVFFFWIGGLISFSAVRQFTAYTLLFNAGLFYLVGLTLVYYLVKELGISLYDAVFGTWKWKKVLKKLHTLHTGDGDLTREKLMDVFDIIDAEGDGNGVIDIDELRDGMKAAKVQIADYEMKRLFRAADDDGDGVIDRTEWNNLAKKIL